MLTSCGRRDRDRDGAAAFAVAKAADPSPATSPPWSRSCSATDVDDGSPWLLVYFEPCALPHASARTATSAFRSTVALWARAAPAQKTAARSPAPARAEAARAAPVRGREINLETARLLGNICVTYRLLCYAVHLEFTRDGRTATRDFVNNVFVENHSQTLSLHLSLSVFLPR